MVDFTFLSPWRPGRQRIVFTNATAARFASFGALPIAFADVSLPDTSIRTRTGTVIGPDLISPAGQRGVGR